MDKERQPARVFLGKEGPFNRLLVIQQPKKKGMKKNEERKRSEIKEKT